MRAPPIYAGFCLLLLLYFAYAKLRGADYWPVLAGTAVSSTRSTGSSSGSSGSGGYFGASSSHK